MKIALIGQKGIPAQAGGIERHVEELSVRLAQAGHEIFVYTRPHYVSSKLKNYKGVNLISLPSVKTKYLDAISHTFISTIHALFQGYDIIHFHAVGPSTLSFIPRILSRAKVIVTFHCRDQFHQKWGLFSRTYLSFGEWTACKFPHQTIAVSKTIKEFCKKRFQKEAIYIPNGVNIPEQENGSNLIGKFGLKKDNYILTVARLVKHKGIHWLIQAYKKLKTDKKLVIVGNSAFTDDYVKYIKNLAKSDPRIIFTGYQTGKTLAQLFKNAYLYVHPSEAEGLPITVLEALSYGKCVLVSNIPENIEATGGFGFVFRNKDVKDLRKKIEKLLAKPDLVCSMGLEATKYAKENYNWDDITRKTIKLYRNLLKSYEHALSSKEKRSLREIKQTISGIIRE